MIDFIKYFFRIKKINLLLTFISLLNFGIMFGAEEKKEEYKIKIKFEKKDKVEKEPFTMFWENFCKTLKIDFNIEDFENSKYDFDFYYKDKWGDWVPVLENYDFKIFYEDFEIFYEDEYLNEKKSTIRYLFFIKNEDNNKIKVYDDIIKNEKFKNISITVYIKEDLKANNEEKKEEKEKKENIEKNNNIEKNLDVKGDKKNNGDVNNDCPCCNCCNCC